MTTSALDPVALNDGTAMPAIGLGTWGFLGARGVDAVLGGLEAGYRLLDTATGYGNEPEVGRAIGETAVPRGSIRVSTKLRGKDHGYREARAAIREARQRLGGAPVDLFLIHWPIPRLGRYVEAWRALIEAREDGEIRSIGVSNFERRHLEAIIDATGVVPVVNQIELHPHFPQAAMRASNRELGIQTVGWSPLGRQGALFREPVVASIAKRLGRTPAQTVLRWHQQLDVVPVPRSSDPRRQRENLDLDGFTLDDTEMERITALGRSGGRLWNGDPETTEFL